MLNLYSIQKQPYILWAVWSAKAKMTPAESVFSLHRHAMPCHRWRCLLWLSSTESKSPRGTKLEAYPLCMGEQGRKHPASAMEGESKLRALAVVSECQNRPSGETSHSNWWLCIRQMHFYRVIHLPTSFLPLFLAAMFPHYHYSLLPHHLSLTPFSFILPFYASTSSSSPPSLCLLCA